MFVGKPLDAHTSLRHQGVRDTSLLTFVPSLRTLRVAAPMSVETTLNAADFLLENAVKPVEASKPADNTDKELRDEVQRLEATVAQQQETIKQMRDTHEMELNKKDEEIAALKTEIDKLHAEVRELRAELNALRNLFSPT